MNGSNLSCPDLTKSWVSNMKMRKDTKTKIEGQQTLFDKAELEDWKEEWKGMPEFIQNDVAPYKSITVYFENQEDVDAFEKLIGYSINSGGGPAKGKTIWFPPAKIGRIAGKLYVSKKED